MRSPRRLLRELNAYRKRQRAMLRESNQRHIEQPAGPSTPATPATPAGPAELAGHSGPAQRSTHTERTERHTQHTEQPHSDPEHPHAEPPVAPHQRNQSPHDTYGFAGRPFDRHSPFYIGFVATLGGLIAWTLFGLLGRLTTTMTILIVAFFLTLALNPIVEWLLSKGLRRAWSVLIVFAGVVFIAFLIGLVVVPPVVKEGTALLNSAPDYFTRLIQAPWMQELERDFQVIERAQEEFTKRVQDGSLVAQIFGGVLGAGKAVVNGIFQFGTILILTLYFLATLPRIKQAAYAAVPATRRPRIISLTEEIMRRTGAYAAGQGLVATVNGICSYIMMTIVGVPYAAVLAVIVGLLGLIPMVGATIGAVVVGVIAFLNEPRSALIVAIYYVIYQQIENYVVVPRIMTSTVSVPGAVTIVAALAGGTLLGVLGALLAIPVAAGLLLLYEEVLLPRQARH